MNNLLSGAIGAVIGSLLSIIYVHFNERVKSRRQLAIEIIDHIETMYHRLMALGTIDFPEFAEKRQEKNLTLLNEDERRQYVTEFLRLLTSYTPIAKVEIVFNDSELTHCLEGLTQGFQKAFREVNNKDQSKFMDLLKIEVDPDYQKLTAMLKKKLKIFGLF
jgi:hypothetical protein